MANPFTSLFEPSGGTTEGSVNPFGLVGRIMGQPTTGERTGSLIGEGVAALSKGLDDGLTPQQSVVKFMQTPLGQQAFTGTGGTFQAIMDQFIKNVTPPNPTAIQTNPGQTSTMFQGGQPAGSVSVPTTEQQNRDIPSLHNIPAGGAATDPRNPGGPIIRNPTETTQTFRDFTKDLAPAITSGLAQLQATPADQRPGQLERAVDNLVVSGQLDGTIGEKIKAGILEIRSVKSLLDGTEIGFSIVDKSRVDANGTPITTFHPRIQPSPSSQPLPASPGVQGDGAPRDPKITMFRASGLGPAVSNIVSSGAENLSPKAATAKSREDAINLAHYEQLRTAVQSLVANQQGLGTPKALIDQLEALVPKPGLTSRPETKAIQDGIQLRNMVEKEVKAEEAIMTAPPGSQAQEVRQQANKRLNAYNRILRAMPSIPEMEAENERITAGTAGAGLAARTSGAVSTAVGGVVQGVKDTVSGIGEGLSTKKPTAAAPVTPPAPDAATPAATPTPAPAATPRPAPQTNADPARDVETIAKVPTMNLSQIQQVIAQNPSPALQAALRARILELKTGKK